MSFRSAEESECDKDSLLMFQDDIGARIAKAQVNFKKSPKERLTKDYCEGRIDILESLWSQFMFGHSGLLRKVPRKELLDTDYMKENFYDKIEESYLSCKCLIKEKLNSLVTVNVESLVTVESKKTEGKYSQVKLPKINIPNFSGQYSEWNTFRDLFNSLIHNRKDLDCVQKLHYLKGYLSGEAEQLLRHIPVTEDNYHRCWELLEQRYNNKKYVCNYILKRLFSQRNLMNESPAGLKDLIDTTNDCLAALKGIGVDVGSWDVIVIHVLTLKLDPETRRQWEFSVTDTNSTDELPTYSQFKDFLTNRYRAMEFLPLDNRIKSNYRTMEAQPQDFRFKNNKLQHHPTNPHAHPVKSFHLANFECPFCKEEHKISYCQKFVKETVDTRRDFVQSNGICFCCLGSNHSAKFCRLNVRCRICNSKHHTLLHPRGTDVGKDTGKGSGANNKRDDSGTAGPSSTPEAVVSCVSAEKVFNQVLLATALVKAKTRNGENFMIRALLDQGSQSSFITEATVQSLRLKKIPVSRKISGVGGNNGLVSKAMVNVDVTSRIDPKVIINVKAYVLKSITSLIPISKIENMEWKELTEILLADPEYHTPSRIDILLGAEVYGQVLQEGVKKGPLGSPIAQCTSLGWILSGAVNESTKCLNEMKVMHCQVDDNNLLKKFWELESDAVVPNKDIMLNNEERYCEKFFAETTERDAEGRYIVRLPFKAEGSLSDFATRKVHYTANNPLKKGLFTPDSRPQCVRNLYEKATVDKLSASILDQLRKDSQHSPYLLCTPVFGTKRRKIYQKVDVEIETHIPSVVEHLRKWTSKEAIGDVTVLPDASLRIASSITLTPDELSECGSGDEEPIDHRLPSPEEQLRVIASKFSPELVAIDTSGKFFDRMCSSRKSLLAECSPGETDTVKRRTRSKKPRGKRRNTISGTDQKELREAIAGDTSTAVASEEIEDNSTVFRSRSSDLLKKSPIDPITKKGHFNTLKQWGKNRLKMIGRSPSASRDSFKDTMKSDKNKDAKSPTRTEEVEVQETVTLRKKRSGEDDRKSHQRCASYSSSEKSIGVPTIIPPPTATINVGVKLRGTSIQRRLRRSGIGKEEPHSSSGNWSASSESGRTSIGSEITTTTVPPKSTTSAATSNNSLNLHHGPPSSIISRRRFLNTSGSGSVTSEGTLTPDIIHDLHEDMETSSEFSCDTEGYYTSFHMDSGLKTLKEEEVTPCTPMHTSNALSTSSNSQNLTAENEYELFGKGSTSTTTSSAGTVCTTLMAAGSDRSLVIGPTVPERKSSLTKINRSRSNNIHSANASLDRSGNSSFSKSPFSSLRYPIRSYQDKQVCNYSSPEISEVPTSTITITRNIGNQSEITAVAEIHTETDIESIKKSTGTSSPDSGHNTSSSPIEDSVSSAHGKNSLSEQDYSESSDLEGTDRIERIRYKTTINSSRIPSMCVITPTNSDDESETSAKDSEMGTTSDCEKIEHTVKKTSNRPKLELPKAEKFTKEDKCQESVKATKPQNQINLKSSLQPFNNLMCKLKGVLPHKNKKSPVSKEPPAVANLYDAGDYVTIADVKNNNQKLSLNRSLYGNNDIVRKNLQTVLSGKLPDTEYVSLNELPNCLNESKDYLEHGLETKPSSGLEDIQKKGAKVTLDSQGQVIYSSDTLKRRKGAYTTFEPGPCVQEISLTKAVIQRETANVVNIVDETDFPYEPPPPSSKPTSPQLGKMVIKAPVEPDGLVTAVYVPFPPAKPSTIITATPVTETVAKSTPALTKTNQNLPRVVEAITRTGAYVNIHDAEGVSLSPTKDNLADCRHSNADKPYLNIPQSVVDARCPTVDLRALQPALARQPAARLRGRAAGLTYENPPPHDERPRFWTLPNRSTTGVAALNPNYPINSPLDSNTERRITSSSGGDESIRISPIDPRTLGPFKSSTPSNKVIDLSAKMLSPVKSTMTNEELYAVIHKSKKKLNIKDTPDRAESPALSTISLSPVNSETSLYNKGTQRHPETGYLGDPRTRMSWSPSEKQNMPTFSAASLYGAQRQETTCADRFGPVPQTSRLDFKKLLLQHSVKLNTLNPQTKSNKLSAVEQLKLTRDKASIPIPLTGNKSQVNILDLSGSPKTYTNRKVFKATPQPASPSRTGALIKEHKNTPKILLSPKAQWRFSSPRSDVLSSPIPEANNEDESNSSGERHDISPNNPPSKTVPIKTNQHFGARRNLIPINEYTDADLEFVEGDRFDRGVFPLDSDLPKSHGPSRAEILQAKRAEFFSSPPRPEKSPPRLTSFRDPAASRSKSSPERKTGSPSTLETAL